MKLKSIFSNNAMFLYDSDLEIKGSGIHNETITLTVINSSNNSTYCSVKGVADNEGHFTIKIHTPNYSFDTYEFVFRSETEELRLSNILFGMLWISNGQSNMEMQNHYMDDNQAVYNALAERKIRIYLQDWMGDLSMGPEEFQKVQATGKSCLTNWMNEFAVDPVMPYEPVYDTNGVWLTCSKDEILKTERSSALATSAILQVYDYVNNDRFPLNMPVGFVNVSIGGTNCEAWVPREEIEKSPDCLKYLKENNQDFDIKRWNNTEVATYNQSSCLFNLKIAPLIGLKFSGMMWYQGENNVMNVHAYELYKELMKAMLSGYKRLFEKENFTIIASQINPYLYDEKHCALFKINKALTEVAEEFSENFATVSNLDLKAYWQQGRNHPIHPAHKYELGKRFGEIIINRYFNDMSKLAVNSAVSAISCKYDEKCAYVTFNTRTCHLVLKGRNGFRISSDGVKYFDAKAMVIGENVLKLWSDSVQNPKFCGYNCSDMDWTPSLWCGRMPASSFLFAEDYPDMENHAWLFTEIESYSILSGYPGGLDIWKRPTWKPIVTEANETELCRDDAFAVSSPAALRLHGNHGSCGAYVTAYAGARLDFTKYSGLTFEIRYPGPVKCSCTITIAQKDGSSAELLQNVALDSRLGFCRDKMKVAFDLPDGVMDDDILRLTLNFENPNTIPEICSVSLENFELI